MILFKAVFTERGIEWETKFKTVRESDRFVDTCLRNCVSFTGQRRGRLHIYHLTEAMKNKFATLQVGRIF